MRRPPAVTESVLADALGAVSDGILITDASGTILFSNEAFTRITGYQGAEIVGRDSGFLHGPSTSPAELQRMREALDAAEIFEGTLLDHRKDGSTFWNQLTVTPLTDGSGTVAHVVSVHRELRDALAPDGLAESTGAASHDGELVMFMQPIVDLHTGLVRQVEALARIRTPDGGIELPDSFLPSFSPQQLVELFKEGLDQSLAWVAQWQGAGVELDVSVNVPAELLNDPDSAGWVRDALTRHGQPAHRLSLELLETQELDLSLSDRTIAELVRLGVKIHLDDVGSGFSTLKRVTDIPFDAIKIDRGLFDQVHTRPLQVLIVLAAITALGAEAGSAVVVEGIEDRERLEVSEAIGADFVQGFLFARPMPPEQIPTWVTQFSMPYRDGEVTTPLGALAYHWTHSRDAGQVHPSRDACPLTRYFAAADPELAGLHDSLHAAGPVKGRAVDEITARLVAEVQHSEVGGPK